MQTTLKKRAARRAAKATARHSAQGTISKLRREPLRASTLIAAGVVAGLLGGWLLARGPGA